MSDQKPATAKEIAEMLQHAYFEDILDLCDEYADDSRKQVQKARQTALNRYEKEKADRERVAQMYAYQKELSGGKVCLGIDEVGRGSIAGPLTVCAVCLPDEPYIWGLNDSKQLTPKKRGELADAIHDMAIAIGMCHIPPHKIDEFGMAKCLRMAMGQAIENAGIDADAILIDGNPVRIHKNEICVVKGDAKIANIAAASIVAKVARDAIMAGYDVKYPEYHLAECKGYASPAHIEGIKKHGLTCIHRESFCLNFLDGSRLF